MASRQQKKNVNQKRFLGVFLQGTLTFLFVSVVASTVAYAGSITPPVGAPVATFYTLTNIYHLISSNTTSTEGSHGFTFGDSLSGSGYTLTQIYDALAGLITASTVLTGNTYLGVAGTFNATNLSATTVKSGVSFGVGLTGAYPSATDLLSGGTATADLVSSGGNITSSNGSVEWWQSSGTRVTATLDFPTLSNVCSTDTSNGSAGTLSVSTSTIGAGNTVCGVQGAILANLFNGSTTTYPGGTQANGGVEDGNTLVSSSPQAPPVDRYQGSWTLCSAGNSYCGTGDTGAYVKDNHTNLVWSSMCNGSGCVSFASGASTGDQYTWDTSGANNNSRTAAQLCSDHTGWYLPGQKQWMQAYINGAYGNVDPAGAFRFYWTGTTVSENTAQAWNIWLSQGRMVNIAKGVEFGVRCVWPAS